MRNFFTAVIASLPKIPKGPQLLSPTLSFDGFTFSFRCSFADRHLAKDAGFRFDTDTKLWCTRDMAAAVRLRDYADSSAKAQIRRKTIVVSLWPHPLPPPPKGLTLLPHQTAAINFVLSRNHCYLAAKPGLGKTIMAAMVARALGVQGRPQRVVYIMPPELSRNTMAEFERWGALDNVYVFPDSTLTKPDTEDTIRSLAVSGWADTIIVDEAQRFKNPDARRTRALLSAGGLVHLFKRHIFLSGSPMPNRPIELYPVLAASAPESIDFMNMFAYGIKYCGGYRSRFGWNFTGATNIDELRERVIYPASPFMLRMDDTLLNLPPLTEEIFVLSTDMSPRLTTMDADIGKRYSSGDDALKAKLSKYGTLHMATYRKLIGAEKVKPAAQYIKSILVDSDESLIVFAYHVEVIASLSKALAEYSPIIIDGSVPVEMRNGLVKDFQNTKGARLIIGNYAAMGVGFTLTKASRVLFVEYSWDPGVNDQAAKRAHRIGQTKSVSVQYMVYKDSLDKAVIEALIRKRETTQHF